MSTKTQQIRVLLEAGEDIEALRIAKGMQLSPDDPDRDAIQRAWEAHKRPDFSRQLKRDPIVLLRDGIEALRKRFVRG